MRGMATLAAALLVGLGTAAAQERPGESTPAPKPESGGGGWLTWLWPFGRKTEEKRPPASEPRGPSSVEAAQAVRNRELAALFRRQEVCLRLRDIAIRTGDQALLRQAEELEDMARDTYNLRTAHLAPGNGAPPADEGTLARRLGPGAGQTGSAALLSGGREQGNSGQLAERRDR